MIVSVTLNAAIDHILVIDGLKPHDTNRVVQMQTDAGGKGINLSRVAVEMGATSVATGFVCGGPGAFIKYILDRDGVKHEFVETQGETRTNFNVESGDGPPTTFNARGPKILASEWQELLEKCERLFESANWVTLGGSLPQDVPPDSFAILGQLAKECSCRFALDADGEPMLKGLEAGPNLIKPNLREAERILDAAIPADPVSAVEAARAIRAKYMEQNPDMIVALTMGAKGAVMVNESGAWIGDPIEVDSRSTIGAGDSLLGGMIAAIEDGESWETALAWGLAAGAATATTDGTEIGRWEVISKFLPIARVRKS